jgi:hypothetical protein
LGRKPERTATSYAIAVWMAINILLMILLIDLFAIIDFAIFRTGAKLFKEKKSFQN